MFRRFGGQLEEHFYSLPSAITTSIHFTRCSPRGVSIRPRRGRGRGVAERPGAISQIEGIRRMSLCSVIANSITFQRSLEEVIKLIKKHEAFEKSAQAQEERFQALEKLTTVGAFRMLSALFA